VHDHARSACKTVTSALTGTLRTDARTRAEFFALADMPG
jgi:GTP cyclohydrolase I